MDSNSVASLVIGERLHDYERRKLELAATLRQVLLLVGTKNDDGHRKCQELLARLAEDRFTLAVVGQFSRGKSSLMNAILGLDRLPVGLVPLTSVITKVAYGNPEKALIEYQTHRFKSEIRIEELPEYVTETGNPGNQRGIAAAEIQLPSLFLRRGLYFVDTPGVGSVIAANTATTQAFLPNADAVIFVTSFDSPFSREELEFLSKVREHVEKIFFVVNKSDLVSDADRDQVLAFLRNRLRCEIPGSDPRIFPVSALLALRAKLSGSREALARTGLVELEQSLIDFLTTDKTVEFLTRTCDLAISFLGDLQAGSLASAMNASSPENSSSASQEPPRETAAPPSIDELLGRLIEFRKTITVDANEEGKRAEPDPARNLPIPEAELMVATRKPCRVCRITADAMFRFMSQYQYEILANVQTRSRLAKNGGMCPLHTWQYSEISSPQGISGSYAEVLRVLSERLRSLAESEESSSLNTRTQDLTASPKNCCACLRQREAQEEAIAEIVRELSAPNGSEKSALPVLCLPHLVLTLKKVKDPVLAHRLLEFEAALVERLAESMERYALKHDALRRHLQSEDEEVAYHRALSQLVSDKRLQSPWRVEYLL